MAIESTSNRWRCPRLLIAPVLVGSLPSLAVAQTADTDSYELHEIVVTAQKREESLNDVPLAIVVFDGAALTQSGTTNTFDLQLKTPSLVLTTNGAFGQPYIRGIGTDILGAASDPSVAVNVDGVYMARATAAIQDFYDVERVEVVKGPQGTLYGRNATGGAINIVNKQPENEFSAGFDVTGGNYEMIRRTGFLNVPLGEKAAVRVSGSRTTRDGYSRFVTATGADRRGTLDDENVYGGRIQFRAEPSERLTVSLAADYLNKDDTRFLHNRPNPAFASITPALILGGVVPADIRRSTSDRRDVFAAVKDWGLRSTISYAMDDIEFKSITATRRNEYAADQDIDGTNLNVAWITEGALSRTFTQEFQASSSSSTFEWIVGAFYLHENASSQFNVRLGGDGNPIFGLGLANPTDSLSVAIANAMNRTNAYAAFGQASYYLSDAFSVTVGGRYSWEKKNFTLNDVLAGSQLVDSASWGSFTPKLGIEYHIPDFGMAYASITRGFKSGGFNADGVGEQFEPEKIWSYEAGLKADFADSRLRTNIAGFYYDYSDLQVRVRDPLGTNAIVANVGVAKVYGMELEAQALVTRDFSLNLNVAYLDTEVTGDVFVFNNRTGANENVGGNALPRAPKWTVGGSATYAIPVSGGKVSITGEYRYQSGIFFDIFNRDLALQSGYSLINSRIRYENEDHGWFLGLWGKNLTNTRYRSSVIYNGLGGSLEFFAAPITYGAQVGVVF